MNDTIPHHQSSRCRAIWGPPQRAVFPGKSDVSQLTATSPVMISMQLNYVMQIFKDRGSFRLHPWLEVSNWSCGLLSPEGWEMRAASCVGRKAIILAFHLIQSSCCMCISKCYDICHFWCRLLVALVPTQLSMAALLFLQHNQRGTGWQMIFSFSVLLIRCQNCWSMLIYRWSQTGLLASPLHAVQYLFLKYPSFPWLWPLL